MCMMSLLSSYITLSKILNIIGKKKELLKRKIGENTNKLDTHISLLMISLKGSHK